MFGDIARNQTRIIISDGIVTKHKLAPHSSFLFLSLVCLFDLSHSTHGMQYNLSIFHKENRMDLKHSLHAVRCPPKQDMVSFNLELKPLDLGAIQWQQRKQTLERPKLETWPKRSSLSPSLISNLKEHLDRIASFV
jgi:hypothetical protein